MKKSLYYLIFLLVFTFAGCTTTDTNDHANEQHKKISPILEEYIRNTDNFCPPSHEFGEPAVCILTDKDMVGSIFYPQTDMEIPDKRITEWLTETIVEYKNSLNAMFPSTEAVELSFSYDSYNITDTMASIRISGTISTPDMLYPLNVTKTFNINTATRTILTIKDILLSDTTETFLNKVTAKSGIEASSTTNEIFSNWLLTPNGIEIILPQCEYPTLSDSTKTVSFTYNEINHMLTAPIIPLPKKLSQLPSEALPTLPDTCEIRNLDPNKPMIALTFDDGPGTHTERLLDIFDKYNAKATFFVLGNVIKGREDTLRRIVSGNHELGNHTWNHCQLIDLTYEDIIDEIMMTRAEIYKTTGYDCLIARPPYGAYDETLRTVGKSLGIYYINWSVDTLDWESKDAQAIYEETIASAKKGSIVLCHDIYPTTVDAMETVIPKLIENGYQLVTVSELMAYSQTPLEFGNIYYFQ